MIPDFGMSRNDIAPPKLQLDLNKKRSGRRKVHNPQINQKSQNALTQTKTPTLDTVCHIKVDLSPSPCFSWVVTSLETHNPSGALRRREITQ